MEREAEFTGKKVQDAVNEGLQTLGLTLDDDVEIKILSNGGLFKKAKVVIKYDDGKTEEEVLAEKAAQTQKASASVSEPPADEPQWGSAPTKREPSTVANFGRSQTTPRAKSEKRAPRDEQTDEEQPSEGKKQERRREDRQQQTRRADKTADEKTREKKKQRESVPPTEEQIELAKTFLTELLSRMRIEGNVEIVADEGMRVNVVTEDARVIGHRGEVLDAMQQLVSAQINTAHGKFVHVTVDGLGYRDRRKETLEGMARRMADKAVRTHRKVALDAMNSADRRIVHAALGDRDDVFTKSEGHDPARRVVIIPKRK